MTTEQSEQRSHLAQRESGPASTFIDQRIEKSGIHEALPHRGTVSASLDRAHRAGSADVFEKFRKRIDQLMHVHGASYLSPSPRATMPRRISLVPPRKEKLGAI